MTASAILALNAEGGQIRSVEHLSLREQIGGWESHPGGR